MKRRRGPIALAELVGKALDPVTARRGFATAELIAGWAEIVGARYADCSRPERIVWPRGAANEGKPGTLIVTIDGPRALFFQHEVDQVTQRVNSFLGHGAIGNIKIVQGPVVVPSHQQAAEPAPPDPCDRTHLNETLAEVGSDSLRAALDRLGRAVLANLDKKS